MKTAPENNSPNLELAEMAIIARLRDIYSERKAKNELYSFRAFARDLDVSQSLLSLMMAGKRSLTSKQFAKISSLVGSGLDGVTHLGTQLRKSKKGSQKRTPLTDRVELDEIKNLDAEQFKMMAQWYHLPILALSSIAGYQPDARYIAKQIGITTTEASSALDRLITLNLLTEEGYALAAKTGTHARFNPKNSSAAVRSYHQAMIKKTEAILNRTETADFEARSIRGLSLAIDPDRIGQAKKEIEAFEKRFTRKFTTGKPKQVYQLNLQFYPLTQTPKKDQRK